MTQIMKRYGFITGLLAAGAMLLASCDLNDDPKFNDGDAFIAFTSTTLSVTENVEGGKLEIPVLLTSLSGLSSTVDFEIIPDETRPAEEGKQFTVEGDSRTLTFTKEAPTQKIVLDIVDNDVFTGDTKFVLKLKKTGDVVLGDSKTCTVTISDDEHPLKSILGTYMAAGWTYQTNDEPWEMVIEKDDEDLNKVWIGNWDPYFAKNGVKAPKSNNFYGIVSDDKTEISVPTGQKLGYENVELQGWDCTDPYHEEGNLLPAGGNMIIKILDGGKTLKVENGWWTYDDGWWNVGSAMTLTKQ